MTKPAQNHHNRIAGKPALGARKDAQRPPYSEVVLPTRLILNFVHDFTLQRFHTIPQRVGYVNGR